MPGRREAVGLGLGLGLAGCGGAPPSGGAAPPPAPAVSAAVSAGAPGARSAAPVAVPSTGFNGTDVMFLQMMVPHHGQGIELARMARQRSTRAELRTLAAAIEATQASEVDRMTGWLRGWNQPSAAPSHEHAAHGGMPETSRAEFELLAKATGDAFERRFLNTMIAHQDDAIQLARMETATGVNFRAKDLAQQIERSRHAQIQQMLKYLT